MPWRSCTISGHFMTARPVNPLIFAHRPAPASLVYVITVGFQFGAVDLRRGNFLPIGPALPGDVGTGLTPGRGTSLVSLGFSGNLWAIDPFTGVTSIVGATGLGDCSMPGSYAPNCTNVIGRLDKTLYAIDFAQNLYSLNPATGAAKLIGPPAFSRLHLLLSAKIRMARLMSTLKVYSASTAGFTHYFLRRRLPSQPIRPRHPRLSGPYSSRALRNQRQDRTCHLDCAH